MSRRRRIAGRAVAVAALWLLAMVIAGWLLEGHTRGRVAERIAGSLQAGATIERGDLALVRGWLDLDELAVRRDDLVGHLAITVAHLHCELPVFGLALLDRSCRELIVRDGRLEVSSAALFKLQRPKRPPFRVGHVVIERARLELLPSAILPDLGRITVDIARAEAGPTVFKTPLSWLFALRALDATIALPGGITLHMTYDHGELRVAGGILGATPIAVPIALPVADAADDAHAEILKLVALGKDVAQRLVTQKAEDWLRSKLSQP